MPTFIMMGSTITAAISPGYLANNRSTPATSLNWAIRVLATVAFGTPAPPGTEVGNVSPDFRSFGLQRDQHRIVQSVIAAFHLDDFVAAGRGPGQANGVHGAFRAAVADPHHLYRKPLTNLFS